MPYLYFLQLYGEDVFKELFRKILKICIDQGMVSGRRQAVDSALIKANASMDSIAEKEIMTDADAFADELASNEEDKPQKVSSVQKEESRRTPPLEKESLRWHARQ